MTGTRKRLLLVEDDARYRERMKRNLEREGYEVIEAADGEEALEVLRHQGCTLILTDIKMPGMSGLELIRRVREGLEPDLDSEVPIVVLSSVDDYRTVQEAMRDGGAEYYIRKDEDLDAVLYTLAKTIEKHRVEMENVLLREELDQRSEFGEIVAVSEAMARVLEEVDAIASAPVTVLVTGESGVGKELVARAIHKKSPRGSRPMIEVNCATLLGDNLTLSELFGHEKGAYTGASSMRKGKFELAHESTLFLDEIGDLPLDTQARILRAIETCQIERLGGSRLISVNVRFVCATNKDLMEEIRAGRFRSDLYHRINVSRIHIPPLRERPEDIPPLIHHLLFALARRYGRPAKGISEEAIALLSSNPWPGNVRELRHLIEGLIFRVSGDSIGADDIRAATPLLSPSVADSVVKLPPEGFPLEEIQRQAVLQALERTGWVQKDAADLLDISADQMNARIRKYGLTHPNWKTHRG